MSIPEFMHLLHTLLNAYMFYIFTNISPSAQILRFVNYFKGYVYTTIISYLHHI